MSYVENVFKRNFVRFNANGIPNFTAVMNNGGGKIAPFDTSDVNNKHKYIGVICNDLAGTIEVATGGVFFVGLADGLYYADSNGQLVNSLPGGSFEHLIGYVKDGWMNLTNQQEPSTPVIVPDGLFSPISYKRFRTGSQTLSGGSATVIDFNNLSHDVAYNSENVTYSAGVFTINEDGVYSISSNISLTTPALGVISDVLLELQADLGGGYITYDLHAHSDTIATGQDITLNVNTTLDLSSGDTIRTQISYDTTLGFLLSLLFPTTTSPINQCNIYKIA